MPAAAVIPAPIAYIRVVAVKKLVVVGGERGRKAEECLGRLMCSFGSVLRKAGSPGPACGGRESVAERRES